MLRIAQRQRLSHPCGEATRECLLRLVRDVATRRVDVEAQSCGLVVVVLVVDDHQGRAEVPVAGQRLGRAAVPALVVVDRGRIATGIAASTPVHLPQHDDLLHRRGRRRALALRQRVVGGIDDLVTRIGDADDARTGWRAIPQFVDGEVDAGRTRRPAGKGDLGGVAEAFLCEQFVNRRQCDRAPLEVPPRDIAERQARVALMRAAPQVTGAVLHLHHVRVVQCRVLARIDREHARRGELQCSRGMARPDEVRGHEVALARPALCATGPVRTVSAAFQPHQPARRRGIPADHVDRGRTIVADCRRMDCGVDFLQPPRGRRAWSIRTLNRQVAGRGTAGLAGRVRGGKGQGPRQP
jgi:hypothetical protein